MNEKELEQLGKKWKSEVELAVIRYENKTRQHLPPLSQNAFVHLPKRCELQLLNLRIWTMRYQVSLDFVIDALLSHFPRQGQQTEESTSLGVSLPAFTGPGARKALEEAVLKAYPNGENHSQAKIELKQQLLGIQPLGRIQAKSLDGFVRNYGRAVLYRQRILRKEVRTRRAWRGNPWR